MGRAISLLLIGLLAGWQPSVQGEAAGPQRPEAGVGPSGELSEREAAVHVLNRLGYGPGPGDIEQLLGLGIDTYIERQLRPSTIDESPVLERLLTGYESLTRSSAELLRDYPLPARVRRQMSANGEVDTAAIRRAARLSYRPLTELSEARLARAIYSERQLQEVMVDFWLNHFNVFARKGPIRLFLIEYERDAIRANALGNFRDLLGAVARSPAMLFYLDNWMSSAPEGAPRAADPTRRARRPDRNPGSARRPQGLNENYARELLELHTLGADAGYTQEDVIEVARVFTGWSIDLQTGEYLFRPFMHDLGKKVVLGHSLDGRRDPGEGELVLDLLAHHPATARFIASKLVRRFVSDEPPETLVERVSGTFLSSNGDIREALRVIFTSAEFRSREAFAAKVKTPLEWLVSGVRGLGLESRRFRPLLAALNRLGQPLYGAQVPTGYPDVAEAWVSAGALLLRAQLSQRLAENLARSRGWRAFGEDGAVAAETVLARLLPAANTERLRSLIDSGGDPAAERDRLQKAISLALAAPEFQRR